jgi:hypothetical protein
MNATRAVLQANPSYLLRNRRWLMPLGVSTLSCMLLYLCTSIVEEGGTAGRVADPISLVLAIVSLLGKITAAGSLAMACVVVFSVDTKSAVVARVALPALTLAITGYLVWQWLGAHG